MVRKVIFAVIFLLAAVSGGCSPGLYSKRFIVSGTFLTVSSPRPEACGLVYEEIKRLDRIFSYYDPDSELSRLNASYGRDIKVSPELMSVMEKARSVYDITGGYFDVSHGRLYEFWKERIDSKDMRSLPGREEITKLKESGGMENVIMDAERGTIKINSAGLKIDLSGIAKGFMVDSAVRKLKDNSIDRAVIDFGGDIYCLGRNHSKPWRIGVKDPVNRGFLVSSLNLSDQAVATSGGYERFFEYGNQKFSHLIDPVTGYPSRSEILSVSVVSGELAIADALATACFLMGVDKIREIKKSNRALKILAVVDREGKEKVHVF